MSVFLIIKIQASAFLFLKIMKKYYLSTKKGNNKLIIRKRLQCEQADSYTLFIN